MGGQAGPGGGRVHAHICCVSMGEDMFRRRTAVWLTALLVAAAPAGPGCAGVDVKENLSKIKLPAGFEISVFSDAVPGARMMTQGEKGTLFVGTMDGEVYAIVDGQVHIIAEDLFKPNGVAFRDGALYVAEVNRITRYDGIESRLENPPEPVELSKTFPKIRHHGWKFIKFSPDGYLYVPVGAPCNICESKDEQFASITRMKPDGSGWEVFARGVRNTVGFDWHPETGHLWFTDNGRDYLGEDVPPDELNTAPKKDMHFGYPYCHGNGIPDPDFGAVRGCSEFTPPALPLGPHVAAIGMRFYTGDQFPAEYKNRIFIAEHGSWNRKIPIGYRVMMVRLEGNRAVTYEPFAEGWLEGKKRWGRPSDVEVMPDGAMLVSEVLNGAIYRIAYTGK